MRAKLWYIYKGASTAPCRRPWGTPLGKHNGHVGSYYYHQHDGTAWGIGTLPGVGVTKQIPSVPPLFWLFAIAKTGVTYQISPSYLIFKETERYFCKIKHFVKGEINQRNFSSLHPWSLNRRSAAISHEVVCVTLAFERPFIGEHVTGNRRYPAKRALPAMLTHGR